MKFWKRKKPHPISVTSYSQFALLRSANRKACEHWLDVAETLPLVTQRERDK